jgi:hypothetical protein
MEVTMSTSLVRFLMGTILLAAVCWSILSWQHTGAQGQETKRYVYKVVDVPPDNTAMQNTLNEYGAAGWELVVIGMGDMTSPRLVFKK